MFEALNQPVMSYFEVKMQEYKSKKDLSVEVVKTLNHLMLRPRKSTHRTFCHFKITQTYREVGITATLWRPIFERRWMNAMCAIQCRRKIFHSRSTQKISNTVDESDYYLDDENTWTSH
ncbi:unnamed protein product [Rhizophagus irregularis]|uniref:Uncharacterized protein n=1 Tax=Rhizophagus irregularis TaxID=588596 RepID=A0A916DXW2_9GLOM|nr:unnamed protein product [Rhizophagus irregularis]CAB5180956.1 unnamed protein product [Rhizophagus irregularis]CAB5295446.1 unnamed protein product [Rhizophagus irregularis]